MSGVIRQLVERTVFYSDNISTLFEDLDCTGAMSFSEIRSQIRVVINCRLSFSTGYYSAPNFFTVQELDCIGAVFCIF